MADTQICVFRLVAQVAVPLETEAPLEPLGKYLHFAGSNTWKWSGVHRVHLFGTKGFNMVIRLPSDRDAIHVDPGHQDNMWR